VANTAVGSKKTKNRVIKFNMYKECIALKTGLFQIKCTYLDCKYSYLHEIVNLCQILLPTSA
jgi:hypothetical protein